MLDRNEILGVQPKPRRGVGDGVFFVTVFVLAVTVFGVGAGAWFYASTGDDVPSVALVQ